LVSILITRRVTDMYIVKCRFYVFHAILNWTNGVSRFLSQYKAFSSIRAIEVALFLSLIFQLIGYININLKLFAWFLRLHSIYFWLWLCSKDRSYIVWRRREFSTLWYKIVPIIYVYLGYIEIYLMWFQQCSGSVTEKVRIYPDTIET
jgi:hypothetical protein